MVRWGPCHDMKYDCGFMVDEVKVKRTDDDTRVNWIAERSELSIANDIITIVADSGRARS